MCAGNRDRGEGDIDTLSSPAPNMKNPDDLTNSDEEYLLDITKSELKKYRKRRQLDKLKLSQHLRNAERDFTGAEQRQAEAETSTLLARSAKLEDSTPGSKNISNSPMASGESPSPAWNQPKNAFATEASPILAASPSANTTLGNSTLNETNSPVGNIVFSPGSDTPMQAMSDTTAPLGTQSIDRQQQLGQPRDGVSPQQGSNGTEVTSGLGGGASPQQGSDGTEVTNGLGGGASPQQGSNGTEVTNGLGGGASPQQSSNGTEVTSGLGGEGPLVNVQNSKIATEESVQTHNTPLQHSEKSSAPEGGKAYAAPATNQNSAAASSPPTTGSSNTNAESGVVQDTPGQAQSTVPETPSQAESPQHEEAAVNSVNKLLERSMQRLNTSSSSSPGGSDKTTPEGKETTRSSGASERAKQALARARERAEKKRRKEAAAKASSPATQSNGAADEPKEESLAEMRIRLQKESELRMKNTIESKKKGDSWTTLRKSVVTKANPTGKLSVEDIAKKYLSQARQKLKNKHPEFSEEFRSQKETIEKRQAELQQKEDDLKAKEATLRVQEEVIIRKLLEQQNQLVADLEKIKAEYDVMQQSEPVDSDNLKEKRRSMKKFENETKELEKEVRTRRASLEQLGDMSALELHQQTANNTRRMSQLEGASR